MQVNDAKTCNSLGYQWVVTEETPAKEVSLGNTELDFDPFAEWTTSTGHSLPTDDDYDEEAELAWFENERHFNDSLQLQQKINDIKARMAACGNYIQIPVGGTGGMRWILITCGYWRDNYKIGHVCAKCFARRMGEFRDNAKRALASNNGEGINYIVVDIEVAKQITKGHNRKFYHKIPHEDGQHVFLMVDTNEINIGEPLTLDTINDAIDWKQYANTPDGSRPSGNLGVMSKLPKKDEEEGEKVVVHVQSVHTENISNEDMREALVAAYEETKALDPHTEKELQDALNERTYCYIKYLRMKGAKISTFTSTISEYLVCIDWQAHIQTNLADAKKLKRPIRQR